MTRSHCSATCCAGGPTWSRSLGKASMPRFDANGSMLFAGVAFLDRFERATKAAFAGRTVAMVTRLVVTRLGWGCLPGPSPAWPPAWLTTAAASALSGAAPARPPRPSQGPNAAGSARQRPAQGPTASPALAPARHRRSAKPPVARALHQRCTSVNCGAFATRGASWFCCRRYFYKTGYTTGCKTAFTSPKPRTGAACRLNFLFNV